MALSAKLTKKRPPIIHGRACSIGLLWLALPEPEREALDIMLYRQRLTYSEIYAELEDDKLLVGDGYEVAASQINDHRAGRCSCRKYFGDQMYELAAA